ncbi:MAG TPA: RNA 2',3'-cyclic phosphodiesterase [Anaerolineaceae bacterium]|nr:RNA 2',3'-cyclic phosphodiesterase [Anaerolineaceae bacterium]
MSYRVFTALDLSEQVISDILRFRDIFEPYHPTILRWTKTDQLHLTLKFVGELHESHLQPIQQQMGEIFTKVGEFQLRLQGAGIFPHPRNPRILWVGISPVPALTEIARMNEELFHAFGYPVEKRPFMPHITIARFKDDCSHRELLTFQSFWQEQKKDFQSQQIMDHLTFYQSTLTRQGPTYRIIARVKFH